MLKHVLTLPLLPCLINNRRSLINGQKSKRENQPNDGQQIIKRKQSNSLRIMFRLFLFQENDFLILLWLKARVKMITVEFKCQMAMTVQVGKTLIDDQEK